MASVQLESASMATATEAAVAGDATTIGHRLRPWRNVRPYFPPGPLPSPSIATRAKTGQSAGESGFFLLLLLLSRLTKCQGRYRLP